MAKWCIYCRRDTHRRPNAGGLFRTRDHVIAKSRLKPGEEILTVWACKTCNTMKGNMELGDWIDFMIQNPQWWVAFEMRIAEKKARKKFPGFFNGFNIKAKHIWERGNQKGLDFLNLFEKKNYLYG